MGAGARAQKAAARARQAAARARLCAPVRTDAHRHLLFDVVTPPLRSPSFRNARITIF